MKTISKYNEMDKVFMAMVATLVLCIVFYGSIIFGIYYGIKALISLF